MGEDYNFHLEYSFLVHGYIVGRSEHPPGYIVGRSEQETLGGTITVEMRVNELSH